MPALPLHLPLSLPRFLPARTPARLANLQASQRCSARVQQASYAHRAQEGRPRSKGIAIETRISNSTYRNNDTYRYVVPKNQQPKDEVKRLHTMLRDACNKQDLRTIMELYPGLVATKGLVRTREIAAALHEWIRTKPHPNGDVSLGDALIFADRLVSDIQAGAVLPHPHAHVHLLGIYKECEMYAKGYALWQWLVDRGTNYVSAGVYGAAIELMAYGKILPLSELETMYKNALKQFPGVFAEYHFSPDAVVPDRTQPIAIPGLPVSLLQGILTARVLYGDWRNAYLALDTALRLFPVQLPRRFFEVFIIERPCPEAYMAFTLACRAGVLFKPHHLTNLLKKIHQQMRNKKVSHIDAMANAIYAYLEAGGSLHSFHVSWFIRAFAELDHCATSVASDAQDAVKVQEVFANAAYEFTKTWIQVGVVPTIDIFTALIHVAGKCKVPSLFQACLQDLDAAKLQPSRSHSRIIITAAASLGNKALVEGYWSRIASEAEEEGKQLEHGDWIVLSRACAECGHHDFFSAQLVKYDHMLEESFKEALASRPLTSETPQSQISPGNEPRKWEDIFSEIHRIESKVKNIAAVIMSGQPLDFRRTPFYISLYPTSPFLGPQDELRTIYDALTTDPHQPAPPVRSVPPVLNPLGIPLDELRFQNWLSVLEMMRLAKRHSSQKDGIWANQLSQKERWLGRFVSDLRGTKSPTRISDGPLAEPLVGPEILNAPDSLPESENLTQAPTLSYYIALKPTHMAESPKDSGNTNDMARPAIERHL